MIKSYCKINLSLRVLKRLKSGLHDIQTNTFLLNLYDEINIKKTQGKKNIIIFNGKFKKLINISKNSISATISILKKEKLLKKENFYEIKVKKNIPVFSGLGGGTSNAYYLMQNLLKKKLKIGTKNFFLDKIGTDLILFENKQTFQKSLRKVKKYKKNFYFYFLLVYPYLKCSTKYAYSKVKKYSNSKKFDFSKNMSDDTFVRLIKKQQNDLQSIITKRYKPINKIITSLSFLDGCLISRMTGSGSVCFGMFKSQKLAKLGLKNIKKKFPKYWCVVTKTI